MPLERFNDLLRARAEAEQTSGGKVAFEIAGVAFALDKRGSSSGYEVRLVNADATILVMSRLQLDDEGRQAGPDWNVEVTLRAMYLATHTYDEAVAYVRELARATSMNRHLMQERVRRVDLAADVGGVTFETGDRAAFVGRAKKVTDYVPEMPAGIEKWDAEAHPTRTHWAKGRDSRLTGYSFSMGNPFSGRIYDKEEELRRYTKDDEKCSVEHELWSRSGWTEGESVWRLEFQMRRAALEQFQWKDAAGAVRNGIHTLDDLRENRDGLWAYATGKWLRLAERDGASRQFRSREDARWTTYQSARFATRDAVEPLLRKPKKRGGVTLAQTRGTVLSTLGSIDAISPVSIDPNADTVDWLREGQRAAALDGAALIDILVESLSTDDLARDYLAQRSATRARFASCDDVARGMEAAAA